MKTSEENIINSDIGELYNSVFQLISETRKRVAAFVNAEATLLNFKVGKHIQTFILIWPTNHYQAI